MSLRRLEREQTVNAPLEETFAFFADPRNLEPLTPAFLGFRFIGEPPSILRAGSVIDYQIRLYGVPVRWRTRIETFEPPHRFVDTQISGPYSHWRHTHQFDDAGAGRTRMRDGVEYAIPLGPLGTIAYYLFVARSLDQIFDYRAAKLSELFRSG